MKSKFVRYFITATFLLLPFFVSVQNVKAVDGVCLISGGACIEQTDAQCTASGGKFEAGKACTDFVDYKPGGDSQAAKASAGSYGLNDTAKAAGITTTGNVSGIIGKVTGAALSLVGVAFFLLMLYGGFLWMTARGEEAQTKKARNIIIDAVIGIIIVSAAGIITSFVFTNVTK